MQLTIENKNCLSVPEIICQFLNWSEDEYSSYMYDNGLAYIRQLLPEAPGLADQLERSRIFWNWFKKMYAEMDAALADTYHLDRLPSRNRYTLYHAVHCPVAVAAERKPPRFVYEKKDWRDVLINKIKSL